MLIPELSGSENPVVEKKSSSGFIPDKLEDM